MSLLLATGNKGKLAEFRSLLANTTMVDATVYSPGDLSLEHLQVEETGTTFYENALLKAQAYVAASRRICVADDSGLEVDALGGRPGVHSARYGGQALDDSGRCRHLLAELGQLPPEARTARFRCCLVAAAPDGRVGTVAGVCGGRILDCPVGEGGFGYDPVFLVREYGRSMADLSRAEKDAISHRGRALRALVPILAETFPELLSN